jgi:hypothetical protein
MRWFDFHFGAAMEGRSHMIASGGSAWDKNQNQQYRKRNKLTSAARGRR